MKQSDFIGENGTGSAKQKETQNVSRVLSIQYHAKHGNTEELEKALADQNLANIKSTLDGALTDAIRQARSSTDHMMCIKLLFSKGANLNVVLEGMMFPSNIKLRWTDSTDAGRSKGSS